MNTGTLFGPTIWTVRKPKDHKAVIAAPRKLESVEQRWFVGSHANVGGGCQSDFLAQIPLRWIMKKASLHGLAFKNDIDLDENALKASISDSYREFMYGAYSRFSERFYRPIGESPKETDHRRGRRRGIGSLPDGGRRRSAGNEALRAGVTENQMGDER
jgi:Uncharacterized alpha/beta hydrolase domain (DUF2235)